MKTAGKIHYTNFDFDIYGRTVLAKCVEEILCRKQIRAEVSVDQKSTLCFNEPL